MSPEDREGTEHQPSTSTEGVPLEAERYAWPNSEVDPVETMRALAANLPHVAADEAVFDVPFDTFWRFVEDFETNTPRIEGTVGRLEIQIEMAIDCA